MVDSVIDRVRKASLRQKLRFLLKDSAVYGMASAAGSMLGVISLPIMTRALSAEQYGALDGIATIGALLAVAIMLGQDSALPRFFYESEAEERRKRAVGTALGIELVMGIAVAALLQAAAPFFVGLFMGTDAHLTAFRLMFAAVPFIVLQGFCSNLMKWTFNRNRFILLSIGSSLSYLTCTITLAVGLDWGVAGVFAGHLINSAAFAGLGLWFSRSYLAPPNDPALARKMLGYGLPLAVTSTCRGLVPALDRVLILKLLGAESLGLYAVGFKMAQLLYLPIAAFQTAWNPLSLAIYKEGDAARTYNRVLLYFAMGFSILMFCLEAFSVPAVTLFATERYRAGSSVVLLLAMGIGLEAFSWIAGIGIDLSKKTYLSMASYFIGLAVTFGAALYLIQPYGILGAAGGILAGKSAQAASYTVFGLMAYPLKIDWAKPLSIVVGTFLLCLANRTPLPGSTAPRAVMLCSSAVLLAGLFWAWALPEEDKRTVWQKLGTGFGMMKAGS